MTLITHRWVLGMVSDALGAAQTPWKPCTDSPCQGPRKLVITPPASLAMVSAGGRSAKSTSVPAQGVPGLPVKTGLGSGFGLRVKVEVTVRAK